MKSITAFVAISAMIYCVAEDSDRIQINCGELRKQLVINGTVWEHDSHLDGVIGRTSTSHAIFNTNDDRLYQKCRVFRSNQLRPFAYSVQARNTTYQVDLFFAESNPKRNAAGRRVFDVVVQGAVVQNDFDIFHHAGYSLYTATILSTTAVVTNEILSIELIPKRSHPLLCGIRAVPRESSAVLSSSRSWESIPANVPLTRHEACFVKVGRKAYFIGGRRKAPIHVWDLDARTWLRQEPGPGLKLHHMQCVVVNDAEIWIVSAWTGNCCKETPVSQIWVYDTVQQEWSNNKAGLPVDRQRGAAAAVLVNRTIYVIGGNRGGHGAHAQAVAWVDAYHIESDTWETHLPDASFPRDHGGGGLIGDHLLCVAGGRDSGTVEFFENNVLETECYDLQTGIWETKESIPVGRAGSAYGMSCDGKLVVAGGEGSGRAYHRVDVFDGTHWEAYPPLVVARHGTSLAIDCKANNHDIYIASGAGSQGGSLELDSMEVLSSPAHDEEAYQ